MVAFRGRGGDNGLGRVETTLNPGNKWPEPRSSPKRPKAKRPSTFRRATSTASCRGSSSTRGCSRSPRTGRCRCSSGRKFLAIFSAQPRRVLPGPRRGPQGAARGRASAPPRPTASTRSSSSSAIRARVDELVAAPGRGVHARSCAGARHGGHPLRRLGRARRRATASELTRGVRGPDLPGAHAARGRPRAPVPVHLEPLAQPRRRRARPGRRGERALRAGQGAAAAAPLRRGRPTARASSRSSRSSPRTSTRCSRAWRSSRTTRSGSRATPTSSSRRRSRGPPRRDGDGAAAAQAVRPRPCGSRSTPR